MTIEIKFDWLIHVINFMPRILNWIFAKHNLSVKILHRNPRKNMF